MSTSRGGLLFGEGRRALDHNERVVALITTINLSTGGDWQLSKLIALRAASGSVAAPARPRYIPEPAFALSEG